MAHVPTHHTPRARDRTPQGVHQGQRHLDVELGGEGGHQASEPGPLRPEALGAGEDVGTGQQHRRG